MFVHIDGTEEQDEDSPSWYNRAEITEVINRIHAIQSTNKVVNSDIGIITPYRKQVEKFKGTFNFFKPRYDGIEVGTTEIFQGQERKVIIISTVRSNSRYITYDNKYRLGFLSNPKRLNVAISRAQSLLIIVGNAQLLATNDITWKLLLKYYLDHNLYIGPFFELSSDISSDGEIVVENEDVLNVDNEWRDNI